MLPAYSTEFCFYEALNVLKSKWLRKEIKKKQYWDAAFLMTANYSESIRNIQDIDFRTPDGFFKAKSIVEKYNLDFSDAFQIVSVKHGHNSRFAADSRTVLVTADKRLAQVATEEGLLSWYIFDDIVP